MAPSLYKIHGIVNLKITWLSFRRFLDHPYTVNTQIALRREDVLKSRITG